MQRLTKAFGYEGGAFFSPDGKQIVFRAYYPQTAEEKAEYEQLLARELVAPPWLEIFLVDNMDIDAEGQNLRQLTKNRALNFCPIFTPNGQEILFSSNMDDPKGRNFDLYRMKLDGSGLERLTYHPGFDAFPMLSPDSSKLVWASTRNRKAPGEINLFIADWR